MPMPRPFHQRRRQACKAASKMLGVPAQCRRRPFVVQHIGKLNKLTGTERKFGNRIGQRHRVARLHQ
jgi:hypothetical protein